MSVLHHPIRLAVWVLPLAACGSRGGAPSTAPCPPPPEPSALLALDCRGAVVAGLADGEAEGGAVVLRVAGGEPAPARVVDAWPPADRPPWLGHPPVRAVVLPPGEIRVEFLGRRPAPLRLFTDPRLAGAFANDDGESGEDARDRIDQGLAVRTRDERAVDYGRALGRFVEREGFDRTWFVVLRSGVEPDRAERLVSRIAGPWEGTGVSGARRAWAGDVGAPPGEGCWPLGPDVLEAVGAEPARGARPVTVSYPEGEPVAREIGERLVSATLPGGDAEWLAPSGLSVRAYRAGEPAVEGSDLATVVEVLTSPTHPCSVWGEVRWVESWFGIGLDEARDPAVRVLPIGESAVFRVGAEAEGRR